MCQERGSSEWIKVVLLLVVFGALVDLEGARTGEQIQALLDRGEAVVLNPGEQVELQGPLLVKHKGQIICTGGAKTASDYAVIRHGRGSSGTLIEGNGIEGLRISELILDGNRAEFRQPEGKLAYEPMLSLGGEGSNGQQIYRCIVINSRSAGGWAAIHIQEGGDGIIVRDNIVFASGADIRGNGRSPWEKPFGWGDGISTASRNTLIRNNLIYDATDEGIMVQGGPGSKVIDNVIVSISREMLGGIALIDPFKYYEMEPAGSKRFDYRGVLVEGNRIIAMGGRIHAGLPMGGAAWHPNMGGTTLVGALVRNNMISGKAGGYGYVANGIDDFIVTANKSDAKYSGRGDGLPGNPPDEPSAFLYQAGATGTSTLQKDFTPAQGHVTKVLRSDRGGNVPADSLGYRDIGYPESEAKAIVETACLEMLGRNPSAEERNHWSSWLSETHANSDTLRRQLMTTDEFIDHFGYVNPLDLHVWRSGRWLDMITSTCSELQQQDPGEWPDAGDIHNGLLQRLKFN